MVLHFILAESKGFFRLRFAQLEKCRNSPLDCFSVASFVAMLRVRSHFWFESLISIKKIKGNTLRYYLLFWRRARDFFAFATLSWRNVETVRRTVSLSLLSSLCSEFAPISGSNPLFQSKKIKGNTLRYYLLFWRRARDSNPRNGFGRLHDFQSCSFDQLGQLSISLIALLLYINRYKKSSVNLIKA